MKRNPPRVVVFEGDPLYYGSDHPKIIAEELAFVLPNLVSGIEYEKRRVRVVVEIL